MEYTEINFSKEQIDSFISNSKLYAYLYNNLSKAYFRINETTANFFLKGNAGVFKQTFDIERKGESKESICFSVDFAKWSNALHKFSYADSLTLSISNKNNLIKLSTDSSSDIINLSISKYSEDSSDVITLTHSLPEKKNKITKSGLVLDLNEDILGDFNLVSNLFASQGSVNSVGLGKNGIIYADRATILKTEFVTSIPDDLFESLADDESYIYIHHYLLSLFPYLAKENTKIYFSSNYDSIYWKSEDKELVYMSDYREIAIPDDDQLEGFIPQNKDSLFELSISDFKDALDFFNGFYEGSAWRPITFVSTANKEITLRYRHPEADITKTLPCVCDYDGTFILESEALKKVMNKVRDKRGDSKEGPMIVKVNFDDDAPGVLCQVGDYCNVIFAKLEDDSEI